MCLVTLLTVPGLSHADDWIGGSGLSISALEPQIAAEGGVIRVDLVSSTSVPYCGNASGQAQILEFLFAGGTQETRSALVAAIYLAFAESKAVTFLLSSSGCSPYGYPVVVGMHITS